MAKVTGISRPAPPRRTLNDIAKAVKPITRRPLPTGKATRPSVDILRSVQG